MVSRDDIGNLPELIKLEAYLAIALFSELFRGREGLSMHGISARPLTELLSTSATVCEGRLLEHDQLLKFGITRRWTYACSQARTQGRFGGFGRTLPTGHKRSAQPTKFFFYIVFRIIFVSKSFCNRSVFTARTRKIAGFGSIFPKIFLGEHAHGPP